MSATGSGLNGASRRGVGRGADTSALARAMKGVAIDVLGQPTRTAKKGQEWRYGDNDGLSVDVGEGVWSNKVTGDGGGVIDFLRVQKNLDKTDAIAWMVDNGHLPASDRPKPTGKRQVAAYDYTDADGALLFQIVRFEPKTFRQRRPDPTSPGGWAWAMAGVQQVLYRLPAVIAAVQSGATIYVVEGEKGVGALVGLGVTATCSPGGANKWRDKYAEALIGADVVILPDNDAPGRAHAVMVAKSLHGKASRVRILPLPGLPAGGDVADWIGAGGTAEQLMDLVLRTPEVPPTAASDAAEARQHEPDAGSDVKVAEYLTAEAWAAREFKPPVRLLGDLVTSTSRTFLVGATGLGKTMLGVAIAAGMATGAGFLNWRCDRPARVLYVDGEMPGELVKARIRDAMRRLGREDLGGNLFVYCSDTAEHFATLFPQLGSLEPLNTEAGQSFTYALIEALGGVDAVIFDNVMSLIAGDMKDEVPWSETLPLVSGLTRRQIGQLWLDHAGHNTARQYGSSTKAWRFDAVGIMTELPEDERAPRETAFKLSFDAPGKARRRSPDNWEEFRARTIRLADDKWTSDAAEGSGEGSAGRGKVSPSRAIFHSALMDALVAASTAPGDTTLDAWERECIRRGLIEQAPAGETGAARRNRRRDLRRAQGELLSARWIGIDGNRVSDLVHSYSGSGR